MLTATRLDHALAIRGPHVRGEVERAYRAALYIRAETSRELVVVALDDVGGVPGGILVGGPADLRAFGIGRRCLVDVSRAATWSARLPASARCAPGPRLAARVHVARELAAEGAGEGGFGRLLAPGEVADPFARAAVPHIAALQDSLLVADADGAATAALSLIGLGVGLTPSGDDFLVGLLAGLEATGDPARGRIVAAIGEEAPRRTTTIGAASLVHAAAGQYAERLTDVLLALATERAVGLGRAIARAMAYGATSGADTLVGLFLALDPAAARWLGERRTAA